MYFTFRIENRVEPGIRTHPQPPPSISQQNWARQALFKAISRGEELLRLINGVKIRFRMLIYRYKIRFFIEFRLVFSALITFSTTCYRCGTVSFVRQAAAKSSG